MIESRRDKPDTERLGRLYRQAADVEPDDRLDATVLARVRKAASGPRRQGLRPAGAWGVGLAAAASLVLAVGLVFQYGWQSAPRSEQLEQFGAGTEMEQADKPAAPAVGASRKLEDAGEPAAINEAAELNRDQVAGSRAREEEEREGRESQRTEAHEASMVATTPAEEDGHPIPETWLDQIRELLKNGQLSEARQQARLFREAYPAAEIPTEIREALASDSE